VSKVITLIVLKGSVNSKCKLLNFLTILIKLKKNRSYNEQHGVYIVWGYSKSISTGTLQKHLYTSYY